jgi:hypothetical protein
MRLGRNWRLPELSHLSTLGADESSQNVGIRYYTVEGVTGVGFTLPIVDLESKDREAHFHGIAEMVRGLPEGNWIKFQLKGAASPQIPEISLSRSSAIEKVGGVSKSLRILIERHVSSVGLKLLRKRTQPWEPSTELVRQLKARPLSQEETEAQFEIPKGERNAGSSLDMGSWVVGTLRLRRSGSDEIDWNRLAQIQDELPYPYEINCTVVALSQARLDFWLRGKMNRDRFSNEVTAQDKVDATSDTIREIALHGGALFEWEWILSLKRLSESELRADLESAARALSRLGEVYIETLGCLPSYVASRPGSAPHVTQKEIFPTLLYYLPICAVGESTTQESTSQTTCLIHRVDGSIHGFDLFNGKFLAFNAIITGKTGSGKSVFGNVLSRAILHDPETHLIKVDVGGSYRRECALYGGIEFNFHLDRPSGVDPFTTLGESVTHEKVSVLTELLATLALDEAELHLSKGIRGEFERALSEYVSSRPDQPSLSDFIAQHPDLPRVDILRRFGKGGVFENAIRSLENPTIPSRYTYYNFENIHGAANRDYSTGVMAAVIAYVNLEMIRLSQPEARARGKRMVFFCDETKFFIDKNFNFFLLTTANFRKFGHSVILTGQNIEDFFLAHNGASDRGLILNSPTRIFFENQSKSEFLESEFHLSDSHLAVLGGQAYRGSDFRQFVLQDDLGTRLGRLYLTPREYWEMTSTRTDVDRLDGLKRAVPWIKEDQAIHVMLLESGV